MNSRRLGTLSLLAACLTCAGISLTSCLFESTGSGIGPVAGGTIETTNGVVVTPDGKPAARVTGYLVDEDAWLAKIKDGKSVKIDSFTTNDSGWFEVKRDTNTHVSLLVNATESGILIRHMSRRLIENDYRNKIMLRKHVSYRGAITDSATAARQVYLVGTPYTGLVSESGTFHIDDIPPATYTVVVRRVGADQKEEFVPGGEVTIVKQDTVSPPDTLKPDTSKTLLVEDFEDSDNQSVLGRFLGNGYWEAYSDEYLGGNSTLIRPVNTAAQYFDSALDTTSPEGGHSFKVEYKMGTLIGEENQFPFVYLDNPLGPSGNQNLVHYNLSKLTAVSFWAKGSGSLGVEFLQGQMGSDWKIGAWAAVTLTDAWQHFVITPGQLKVSVFSAPKDPESVKQLMIDSHLPPYSQNPTTWTEMGGMVRTIRFLGTGGTEFWLDDVRLHGLVLDDLLK